MPAAAASYSPFAGIKDATQMGGSRRLGVGKYVVKIDTLRFFQSRKDRSPVFAADLEVVESDNDEFQPGDKVGYATKRGQFAEYFLGDIKAFLMAAGADEDELDEDAADECVSEAQPLRGTLMRCHVTLDTKNPEKGYTRYLFLPHTDK